MIEVEDMHDKYTKSFFYRIMDNNGIWSHPKINTQRTIHIVPLRIQVYIHMVSANLWVYFYLVSLHLWLSSQNPIFHTENFEAGNDGLSGFHLNPKYQNIYLLYYI